MGTHNFVRVRVADSRTRRDPADRHSLENPVRVHVIAPLACSSWEVFRSAPERPRGVRAARKRQPSDAPTSSERRTRSAARAARVRQGSGRVADTAGHTQGLTRKLSGFTMQDSLYRSRILWHSSGMAHDERTSWHLITGTISGAALASTRRGSEGLSQSAGRGSFENPLPNGRSSLGLRREVGSPAPIFAGKPSAMVPNQLEASSFVQVRAPSAQFSAKLRATLATDFGTAVGGPPPDRSSRHPRS